MFYFIRKKIYQHFRHKFRKKYLKLLEECQNTKKIGLNLGNSEGKFYNLYNVDCFYGNQVDIVSNLNNIFPFKDNSIDILYCSHLLEHLPDKIRSMNELGRILKTNGYAIILLPHIDSHYAFADPTHRSFWCLETFAYFNIDNDLFQRFHKIYGIKIGFKIIDFFQDETTIHIILQKT